MEDSFFFKIFEDLPRQGPGDDRYTKKAFELSGLNPAYAEILDIGCGSGMQTIALAKLCSECRITAVDIYQPFLDDLIRKAEINDLHSVIKTVCASMDELPFENGRFDLIWAEGSMFIIGIENAINNWKKLLKPGGKIAFTDAVWFTDNPSPVMERFWKQEYPGMMREDGVCRILESAGFSNIKTFRLPDSAWRNNYYIPLEKKVLELKGKYSGAEENEILDQILNEIAVFEKYSAEYGYTFFIAEKTGT